MPSAAFSSDAAGKETGMNWGHGLKSWKQSGHRAQLPFILAFVVLIGLINVLAVNERTILYLFYSPVVLCAWFLSRRDAMGAAILAGLLVVGYGLLIPSKLGGASSRMDAWADVVIWGGVLILTAYMISTLRACTETAMRDLHQAYVGALAIMTKFIEMVDADAEAHSVRVASWCVRIAQELGLSKPAVEEARIAGMLHDVGKVAVSAGLLRRASELDVLYEQDACLHASRGAALVEGMGGMLRQIAAAIEFQHERYDGMGLNRMQGEQIPLTSRIIAVADAIDALVADQPSRQGVPFFKAVNAIAACAGTNFDPEIVEVLKRIPSSEGNNARNSRYQAAYP
jgi:HD superfamily phosphohydrolase YqeK